MALLVAVKILGFLRSMLLINSIGRFSTMFVTVSVSLPVVLLKGSQVGIRSLLNDYASQVFIDSNRRVTFRRLRHVGGSGFLASGLVVPMRSNSKLCDIVHFSRSNLNFHAPYLSLPVGGGSVVQALVSIGLGRGNVILETSIFQSRSPSLQAQLLSIVAKSTFASTNHFIGFILVVLLGVQNNAKSNGIWNLKDVIALVAKHLFPS
mmetsp:Transcript_7790/g.18775  ORF Transcript_7790/g.18775 Transcript_7790/m.18775 type:complete len:207 (-) Transcript_7790:1454-2074(-)